MAVLFSLAILILDIFAIWDVFKGGLPTEKKLLWVLLIVCLPVLGLILYYLTGRAAK